jgi:putative ABC transport system permease protein
MVHRLLGDARFAVRQWRAHPASCAVVTATIAVAIAASVTASAVVDAWLLRPLPFADAGRLVVAFGATPERPREPAVWLLHRSAAAWRTQTRTLELAALAIFHGVTISGGDEARTAVGLRVTPEFFTVLGVAPQVGRVLTAADRGSPVVVLSHGLWVRHFGGALSVLGSTVRLADVPHTVVGIMPAAFDVRLLDRPEGVEFWTMLPHDTPAYGPDGAGPVALFGRLASGATAADAEAEGKGIVQAHEARQAVSFNRYVVSVARLQDDNTRTVRATLLTLWGAVLALLLIAALNVGALLVGQGIVRRREAAIRLALGAGAGRLFQQALVESLLLVGLGGAIGMGVAALGTRAFTAWNPLGSLPPGGVTMNGRVALAGAALTTLAALVAGVIPARRAAVVDPALALAGSDDHGHTGRRSWGQTALLAGQLTLAVVLVAATTWLARTVVDLRRTPLGFDGRNVTVAQVHLPQAAFPTASARRAFASGLSDALAAAPEVTAVGISSAPLLTGGPVEAVRRAGEPVEDATRFGAQDVTADYFPALAIPLVAGRGFTHADRGEGQAVAVLNVRAATLLFGSAAAAVGQAVNIGRDEPRVVVGVVGNVGSTFFNTLEWLTPPIAYRPASQALDGGGGPVNADVSVHVHVRHLGPLSMARMRALVREAGAQALVTGMRPADAMIAEATRQPGLRALVLSAMSVLGLLLIGVGVFGLVEQSVARQRRAVAIRLALGAVPHHVVASVARPVGVAVILGLAAGVGASLAAGRALSSLLFGVDPNDAMTVLVAVMAVCAVAGAAALVPAWRATRQDPLHVLREQ